ncbi:MAG TPA: hypothetical protein VMH87_03780 [Pseudomonadales bacterium]|nr:hypothetical protein [Pseudomonadales bacterium]
MNTKNVNPYWALAAIIAAAPIAGIICAIGDHNLSMFYVSLLAIPICAIVFPIGMILINLIPSLLISAIFFIIEWVCNLFSRNQKRGN